MKITYNNFITQTFASAKINTFKKRIFFIYPQNPLPYFSLQHESCFPKISRVQFPKSFLSPPMSYHPPQTESSSLLLLLALIILRLSLADVVVHLISDIAREKRERERKSLQEVSEVGFVVPRRCIGTGVAPLVHARLLTVIENRDVIFAAR